MKAFQHYTTLASYYHTMLLKHNHHDIFGKDGEGKIKLRAAPKGTGIIAGGPVRAVCEVLGIKDIVAKSLGTANPHNVIRACLKALLENKKK